MHHSPRQSARPNPAPSLTIFPASGNLSNTSATRHHQEPYEDTDTDNDSDSEDFCQASDFNPTSTQADKPPQCLAPHGWPPNYMPTQHPPRQVGPHLQPPPTRITTPISTAPHENPITQHGNQTTLTHPVLSPEDAAMAAAALNLVTTNYATTTYGTLLTTTMEAAKARTTPISTAPHENPITQHGNQTTLTHPVLSPEDAEMAAAALGMVTAKHATTAYGALMTTTTETALAKTATGQQQSEQPEGSMTNTERPTTTDGQTTEPALEVDKKKGRARGHNRKQLPGNQRKHAKTTNTH
mmetsp:Transcript_19238/g.32622  ORF Transcript_19238/g.32622 Transcript_19238/m.32622 type:complete len:298 (+) Transcript_19238:259-1152(+)